MISIYLSTFFLSLLCILLELLLTRILNLKTWNHVVYIIIPFAILGYGIGANLFLISRERLLKIKTERLLAAGLLVTAVLTFLCPFWIAYLPLHLNDVTHILNKAESWIPLLRAYTLTMFPFVIIGFLVVYLFSKFPKEYSRLYFFDLIGAGLGAYLFFPLINTLEVFHTLILSSLVAAGLALVLLMPRRKNLITALILLLLILSFQWPEFDNYKIDKQKGWEWIPGFLKKHTYSTLVSRWHALGRTNIYRITDPNTRQLVARNAPVTFEINVKPSPEFSYVATNFLSGTPIYNLSKEGMAQNHSGVHLFSTQAEFPYSILKNPDVLVIGTGGGRDIFMAKSHGARKIVGAEINPAIYAALMPGGEMYEYSGKIYTAPDTRVFNIDGRHLVKRQPANAFDLIVLNGVDTFSGLSSGAYAYAESYLYTKEAIKDYLRVLKDDGMINFNRWLFTPPRESLRLQAMALEALREMGAEKPWEHLIMGGDLWSFILVKKTPFTPREREQVFAYFKTHHIALIYPGYDLIKVWDPTLAMFNAYADDFKLGLERYFTKTYHYDISVVTDDKPFFYKYYKLDFFNPFRVEAHHHTGPIIFMTQMIILGQSLVFIILFIFAPLVIFQRRNLPRLSDRKTLAAIIYFSCLGLGYMLIEIALMQKFTLILGNPIHSISVTLAALLAATGVGSFLLPFVQHRLGSASRLITTASLVITALLATIILSSAYLTEIILPWSFPLRVLAVILILFPLGMSLGTFFPAGLQSVGKNHPAAISWAWGINCGFSVLGGVLAIIFAQIIGFNAILSLSFCIYLIAALAFRRMPGSD